jgi:adenylate cyclase
MERRRIRQSFHQHVGQAVADRIYRDDPSLSGECRTATIMFTNLHDFAALAEALSPADVSRHLNEYFSVVAQTVEQHRGLIVDFAGDVAMAVYGAPADNETHALDAVRTALQLRRELAGLNTQWEAQGLPATRVGFGVHTGTVFAGSVGSVARKKYTVVGDTVNVASLVEGLNEELQTAILVTKDTYAAVRRHVNAVDRGEMKLDGRQQPVNVYEVLSLAEGDYTL